MGDHVVDGQEARGRERAHEVGPVPGVGVALGVEEDQVEGGVGERRERRRGVLGAEVDAGAEAHVLEVPGRDRGPGGVDLERRRPTRRSPRRRRRARSSSSRWRCRSRGRSARAWRARGRPAARPSRAPRCARRSSRSALARVVRPAGRVQLLGVGAAGGVMHRLRFWRSRDPRGGARLVSCRAAWPGTPSPSDGAARPSGTGSSPCDEALTALETRLDGLSRPERRGSEHGLARDYKPVMQVALRGEVAGPRRAARRRRRARRRLGGGVHRAGAAAPRRARERRDGLRGAAPGAGRLSARAGRTGRRTGRGR